MNAITTIIATIIQIIVSPPAVYSIVEKIAPARTLKYFAQFLLIVERLNLLWTGTDYIIITNWEPIATNVRTLLKFASADTVNVLRYSAGTKI